MGGLPRDASTPLRSGVLPRPKRRRGTTTVDVLVVGGGPAGLASALALLRRGLDVLVIESGDHRRARAADTLRPDGKHVLSALGVSDGEVSGCRVEGRGIVSAWDTAEAFEQDFFFHPDGPAWHVDRPAFDRVLARSAERAGAAVRLNATLVDLAREQGRWRAMVDVGGDRLPVKARYLIDATGRAARIARRLGASRLTYDRQVALWATFEPSPGETAGSKLLLEAAAGGWWYSIPLVDGRVLAAHVTDSDLLPRGTTLAEAWAAALSVTRYTAARLDRTRQTDESGPTIRPASVGRLTESAGPGWLAVGDAAATLDPLSGSGLTEALLGGQRAAAAVAADAAGDAGALTRYSEQTTRRFEAHLAERARYYGRTRRRSDHLFWRRRRPVDIARAPITLDPMARLTNAAEPVDAATARLEGLMPRQDIVRLRALCARPKEAHRILAEFRDVAGAPLDDRTMIVALQVMIEERLVRAA